MRTFLSCKLKFLNWIFPLGLWLMSPNFNNFHKNKCITPSFFKLMPLIQTRPRQSSLPPISSHNPSNRHPQHKHNEGHPIIPLSNFWPVTTKEDPCWRTHSVIEYVSSGKVFWRPKCSVANIHQHCSYLLHLAQGWETRIYIVSQLFT